MNDRQYQQIVLLLRAIGLGIVGASITVGSFVAGQIAVFLGASTDDARLVTLCTAGFGAVFTVASLVLIVITPRERYRVTRPARADAAPGSALPRPQAQP